LQVAANFQSGDPMLYGVILFLELLYATLKTRHRSETSTALLYVSLMG